MPETRARSLGWEDPLEKGKATHSSVLAWRVPGTREPGGLPSTGSYRVRHAGAPQEWNPDLPHTAAKKEKQPKKAEGAVLTNAAGVVVSGTGYISGAHQ